jgi:S-adenosylmethionine:tRNA ribosyltransferase-isomerase
MISADRPIQRPANAKLMFVSASGEISHALRARFLDFLRPGDLVVANDAATLPASLQGEHMRTGAAVEVRLAGRRSLAAEAVHRFCAVVFGAGDFHTRTEDRPPPPSLATGDRIALGPLSATAESVLGHPRLIMLRFDGRPEAIWAGLSRHGRPIQYAHIRAPLAVWDVWTPMAGPPVAFEPPSASFSLDWRALVMMRSRGIGLATVTHAAGISSTGDKDLDRRLPFYEPYRIPATTARAIFETRARGGRIIAIGTTVVRALEHAAGRHGGLRAGEGLATQRLGPASRLRLVDAILSGTHEPATSHYQLLRAFTDDATLSRASSELESRGYRTHEFGDSMLIERTPSAWRRRSGVAALEASAPAAPASARVLLASGDLASAQVW